MLLDVGVPANLLGFKYLKDAINCVIDDPKVLYKFTGVLYPTVGKLNGTTKIGVEHCMCHAIDASFQRISDDVARKYFGNSANPKERKLTNSEFVAAMALALKENKSE